MAEPLTLEGWRELCEDDRLPINTKMMGQAQSVYPERVGGA